MTKILFVFLGLVLLCGCLEEASIEDRMACVALTSYPFTSVPECSSQEACFAETRKHFSFNEPVFEPNVRQELLNARNSIAKTWLLINRARTSLKKINETCLSSSDFSSVPREVNSLNSSLVNAGREIDSFNKACVKAIHFEISSLENEDVNLVRESLLFNDLVLLNQNELDFLQHNSFGSTYASRFILQAEKFNLVAEAIDIQKAGETNLFEIISGNDKTILSEAKKYNFPVALIGPFFSSASDFLANFFALSGSVTSLKQLPSYELFSSIDSLSGYSNSSASAFFEMFSNDSKHRLSLSESSALVLEQVLQKINEAESKKNSLSKTVSSGKELLFSLSPDSISSVSISPDALEHFDSHYSQRIASVKSVLLSIEEQRVLGSLSLGKESSMLRNAFESIALVIDELSFFDSANASLSDECSARLSAIKKEVNERYSDSANPAIISAKSRLFSAISSFEETKKPELCSLCLNLFAEFSSLETMDASYFEESFDGCISFLAGLEQANGLQEQIASLEAIPRPLQNPELSLEACETIKAGAVSNALKEEGSLGVEALFSELEPKIFSLREFVKAYPLLKSSSEALKLVNDFEETKVFFESSSLLGSALGKTGSISDSLKKISEKFPVVASKIGEEAFLANYIAETTDANFLRIAFENRGPSLEISFSAKTGVDSRGMEGIFSTPNLSYSSIGTETLLHFSGLLNGLNSLVLAQNTGAGPIVETKAGSDPDSFERYRIVSEKDYLLEKAGSPDNDIELSSGKIDFFVDQNQFSLASLELDKLREKILKIDSKNQVEEDAKEKTLSIVETLSQISALEKSILEKASSLKANFEDLSQSELEEVYAFSPITIERVSAIEKLVSGSEVPSFEDISVLVAQSDYSKAAKMLDGEKAGLYLEKLEGVDSELEIVIEKLKQNALSNYNVAVSKRNYSAETSPEADDLLLSSKNALEKKEYLKSILASQKAASITGFASLGNGFEIPLAIYPLLLVIGGGIYFAYKRKEAEKTPKEIIKINSVE